MAFIARTLVRWSARWWRASLHSTNRTGRYDGVWNRAALNVDRLAIPLARRIDPTAAEAQMAAEGWWLIALGDARA